jgi:hypothetical protein
MRKELCLTLASLIRFLMRSLQQCTGLREELVAAVDNITIMRTNVVLIVQQLRALRTSRSACLPLLEPCLESH